MRTPKDPVNYLLKDIPDFVAIVNTFKHLYKRQPNMREVREIQAIWKKSN